MQLARMRYLKPMICHLSGIDHNRGRYGSIRKSFERALAQLGSLQNFARYTFPRCMVAQVLREALTSSLKSYLHISNGSFRRSHLQSFQMSFCRRVLTHLKGQVGLFSSEPYGTLAHPFFRSVGRTPPLFT